MHALHNGSVSEDNTMKEEARKLFHDGLENKLILFFNNILSSSYPEQMDADFFTLWAEETLIEDNLVLDILYLAYYDSFCTCGGEMWKKFGSLYEGILAGDYNLGKLAITTETQQLSYHAKVQLLLILIETLNLENVLQMVHDEVPYRKGVSTFSMTDVQDMDALVSTFNAFEMKEAGPLVLAWAVFLYLLLTLVEKDENNELMVVEIDHISYVRQAIEAGSLRYCLEILECDILKDYDGSVSGYRGVLRTFISAFVASYEFKLQPEDSNCTLILDILCKIYRGEESLCIQFWDKESFIDGPIRSLLCNLESEFPFRTLEIVRLLSSLCEGTWPTEYNFLNRSVGISSLFEINSDLEVVEALQAVQVPGVEGFFIPAGTRGRVLRVVGENTALVRWEYSPSGMFVLLLHLAQEMYLNSKDEVVYTLDLLSRLVTFNTSQGRATTGGRIFTFMDNICQSFLATVETLSSALDASEDILNFLACQVELLLQLTRTVFKSLALHVSLLVLKCSSSGLKLFSALKPLPSEANVIMKLLLTLLLSVLQSDSLNAHSGGATNESSGEDFSKNHLQVPIVMLKLDDKNSASIPIILKFFLTLARVRGGAEMLYCSGFLSSVRALFAESGEDFSRIGSENLGSSCEKFVIPQDIWGLGLAVVTAMVKSLRDNSSGTAIVDSMIQYFFSEKAHLIFNSLNAPDFPSDDHDKKRPQAQRAWISLATLKETEHTLMLMCELAKHWNSWIKAIRNVDRKLREKCIHLLAFISRGSQRLGELSSRNAPLLCPPTVKEDFEICLKPSYVNSRNGWFALSPLGCVPKPKISSFSTALSTYGQATESTDPAPKTGFSDTVALQVYRIAFLLLKFLCLQTECAAKRAEEVGFVDLAHFPELPMPEILHGLQGQAIFITTELCEANKLKVSQETQDVCNLLLQICGIRPHWRVMLF
ncbi:hypothetical protein D0Y65_029491 [Glycine soja]|uniref:Nucleoporin NUP188-like n=1 Tax=Glycine soja TaxID=3848 RepID=A0A445HZN4_GLYSO|nr:hypothetical protein D0Y65_029491 [Glycine soja]